MKLPFRKRYWIMRWMESGMFVYPSRSPFPWPLTSIFSSVHGGPFETQDAADQALAKRVAK